MNITTNTTTLILCAGSQERFNSTTPKQLMPFNDVPLLGRTIWQVKERGHTPHIITRNVDIIEFCNKQYVYLFNPRNNSKCVHTLLSTRELWNGRVIVLLGDVYYNKKCLDLTFNCDQDICFIGNAEEIFSISFRQSEKIVNALEEASQHSQGKLWHFYRAYAGIPLDKHLRDDTGLYFLPSDNTNDIDTMEEYAKLKEEIEITTFS